MIRLSVPARQALSKLTLPVLFATSFGIILLGKVDTMVAERARVSLFDALTPIYAMMEAPLADLRAGVADIAGLWLVRQENDRLRAENARLQQWRATALALEAENRALKTAAHWLPDPRPAFVTARVVADAGGVYAKAVLLSVGPNHFVRVGQVAVDDRGLIGRVSDVGARSARVLLLTDMNSRIPVTLETSHARAVMVGTNGPEPRLLYWSGGRPIEGERIVTSGEANAFPPNLPVGTVHYTASHVPDVVPAARLGQLELVRILDYRTTKTPSATPPPILDAGGEAASFAPSGVPAR